MGRCQRSTAVAEQRKTLRRDTLRYARLFPPGAERNRLRWIARSLTFFEEDPGACKAMPPSGGRSWAADACSRRHDAGATRRKANPRIRSVERTTLGTAKAEARRMTDIPCGSPSKGTAPAGLQLKVSTARLS